VEGPPGVLGWQQPLQQPSQPLQSQQQPPHELGWPYVATGSAPTGGAYQPMSLETFRALPDKVWPLCCGATALDPCGVVVDAVAVRCWQGAGGPAARTWPGGHTCSPPNPRVHAPQPLLAHTNAASRAHTHTHTHTRARTGDPRAARRVAGQRGRDHLQQHARLRGRPQRARLGAGGRVRRRCAVLCCAVLCCAVLCCAVLCCAVLCCAVLCCAVLC
jgi:hypothetical protein